MGQLKSRATWKNNKLKSGIQEIEGEVKKIIEMNAERPQKATMDNLEVQTQQ